MVNIISFVKLGTPEKFVSIRDAQRFGMWKSVESFLSWCGSVVQKRLWVVCASLIIGLLVPNCYLVVSLTSSLLVFPHSSVTTGVTLKFPRTVWVEGGCWRDLQWSGIGANQQLPSLAVRALELLWSCMHDPVFLHINRGKGTVWILFSGWENQDSGK